MGQKIIILSELSHTEKKNTDITHNWKLKKWYKWTYIKNRNRDTDVENKHDNQEGRGKRNKLRDWDWHMQTI